MSNERTATGQKERPIEVGDLVMMVRGHSCVLNLLGGIPFVVSKIVPPSGGGWHCRACRRDSAGPDEHAARGLAPIPGISRKTGPQIPLSWLKRIPPLDEIERDKRKEDLREPA